MKKYALLILIAVLLTVVQMQAVSAAQSDGYIHTNHYYAVSFDGEGDAVVRAQIDVENTLDRAIFSVDLEIPGQAVIYKAVQQRQYGAYPVYEYDRYILPEKYPQYPHPINYTKTLTSDATILHLNLWEPIQRGESSSITLFYKIPLYAKKDSLGNFQFDFRTIIDRDAILIENMRVAVNVQEGFVLKGGDAKVDYRPNTGFMGEAAMSSVASADVSSPQYRQYYDGIRNADGLVKTTSGVDAFESFHVKGTYGENGFLVNMPETLIWLVIGILGIAGLALVVKKGLGAIKIKGKIDTNGWGKIGFISFASAAGVIAINAVTFFIAQEISKISYRFELAMMGIVLLGILASAGVLFLPPLYTASKEGVVKGALMFFLSIGILIAIVIGLQLLLSALFPPIYTYASM
ncbi:MAG TPA: hypothetical protein VJH23_05220 [archaeon]|nr:hypothetical protein [archaeon]